MSHKPIADHGTQVATTSCGAPAETRGQPGGATSRRVDVFQGHGEPGGCWTPPSDNGNNLRTKLSQITINAQKKQKPFVYVLKDEYWIIVI